MSGIIDTVYLKDDERADYAALNTVVREPKYLVLGTAVLLAYLALTSAVLVLLLRYSTPSSIEIGIMLFGVVVAFGWIPAGLVFRRGSIRAAEARDERLREFAYCIDYELRLPRPAGESRGSGSRRQLQHEFYEGHSEFTWRDRERAEMFGMDADTYASNMLDYDRD